MFGNLVARGNIPMLFVGGLFILVTYHQPLKWFMESH
jgi:hypothetical protein